VHCGIGTGRRISEVEQLSAIEFAAGALDVDRRFQPLAVPHQACGERRRHHGSVGENPVIGRKYAHIAMPDGLAVRLLVHDLVEDRLLSGRPYAGCNFAHLVGEQIIGSTMKG